MYPISYFRLCVVLALVKVSVQFSSKFQEDNGEPLVLSVGTEETTESVDEEGSVVVLSESDEKELVEPPTEPKEEMKPADQTDITLEEVQTEVKVVGEKEEQETTGNQPESNSREETADPSLPVGPTPNTPQLSITENAGEIGKRVEPAIFPNRVARFNRPVAAILQQGKYVIEELNGRIIQDIDHIRDYLTKQRSLRNIN